MCALVLFGAAAAHAQDAPAEPLLTLADWNDAVSWTSALREPIRRLTSRVVTTYGIASLADIACPLDRSLGSDLFREAVTDLNSVPDASFHDSRKVLPVATFSGLWKLVIGRGLKCDAALPQPNDRAREKRESERREASSFLGEARIRMSDDPERAAQLAQAALEAGDPYELDISPVTSFLIEFRVRAPDLADDLFQRAIGFTLEAEIPNIDALADLGNYLFVAPKFAEKKEPILDRITYAANGSSFSNWQADREEANPDLVAVYIGAVTGVLANNSAAVNSDPAAAYALAYQLLPKARDSALGDADTLEKIVGQMQEQNPSTGPAVEGKLGAEPVTVESPRAKFRHLMTQLRSALSAGRFTEAREILAEVDGVTVRSVIGSVIDFAEAANAVRGKDSDRAMALAGRLPAGVKRALVYAGIVATSADRVTAIFALHFGLKDADLLSYEQRTAVLPALATASSGVDRDETQAVLGLLIAALNDANTNPRKIRFDPRSPFSFDGPRILFGSSGFEEVVQGNQGRQTFPLRVTGANAFSLADFIGQAKGVDFMRLEASVQGLRNELQLTKAFVALARLRLKMAKGTR